MSSQPKWSLGSWAYEWNANGSLHKIKRADGKVFTFKYDAFGRRISKSYHRREFLYIWDGNVLLHEIKKDYQLEDQLTTWIFQDFVPVAKLQGGKSYSIISDHIGTPILAVDTNGVKVWERELDIYGKVRKLQGDKWFMPFLYQGQYYDSEVDLCYNRFRYYDCNIGSYISQDPIRLAGNNPTLYGYVFDTNTWVDVFGLDCSKNDKKPIIYKFKKVEDVEHFEKHSKSIMNALEVDSYNLKQYLVDANMVIKEGIFIPQINGYAKLIGGVGSAKFGFVGLDRLTNNITTFHIKTLGELAKKSPDIFIK